MSIKVQCESCGMRRRVNERLAGRTIRCPQCEKPLTIPELVQQAEPIAQGELLTAEPFEAEPLDARPLGTEAVEAESVDAESLEAESVEAEAMTAEPVHAGAGASQLGGGSSMLERSPAPTHSWPPGTQSAAPVHHAEHAPSAFITDDDDAAPLPRKKREDGELDMTPMVDVTFLLLIFFMVTASFSLQKSIQMPRQNSDLPSMSNEDEPTEELDPIELEIDENGGFLVLTNEGENETPGKHNLINALKAAIGANKDGMRLDIKVHENAKLQMLVDGMDAGTIAGFTEIQVAEVDGFD